MSTDTSKSKSAKEIFSEEEISLLDLVRLFTDRKTFMFVSLGVFFLIGVLIVITSPVEYEAEVQILSEDNSSGRSGLSGLGGLAGLAGISLPESGAAQGLGPAMYPTIVSSQPFLLGLMDERFYFQEKAAELSLFEYFSEERPGHIFTKTFDLLIGFPGRFFSLFEKKKEWALPEDVVPIARFQKDSVADLKALPILSISRNQEYVMKELASRITIEPVGKIITIKVKMPEPYIAAQLNNIVRMKIIDYVTGYKTDKQRQNLEFVEERAKEAEDKFKSAQLRLASFRDSNQGMVTQTARTKEEQLQAEYSLAFSIYSKLAQELEQKKIQLKDESPIFTEFQPVSVPFKNSDPNVAKILTIYIALGILVGGIIVFFSIVTSYFKEAS
ncbi:Wzz/FepE/Etk N-terminal domain-containing protein [uncultured Imperialibacter sp.]|uniref:Wzz/FepE/Etk N-terminal domain-containing protein n=1 Tax=uncultured Imperialibacter sp. TaxID=1672639 RepID=UPI0030DAB087|tara:strand:+ start:106259 stop:107416 length:1158 start_codon:yes stop_codon:yes gene_type:complete